MATNKYSQRKQREQESKEREVSTSPLIGMESLSENKCWNLRSLIFGLVIFSARSAKVAIEH
jgi:hypothetical protein